MQGWSSVSFCFLSGKIIPDLVTNPKKILAGPLASCPCPSSCPCPCQLVKVAFMACRCFLYESDRVWERNADQTIWGERKPKGGNLKTTLPSEIFTTTAQGEWKRGQKTDRRMAKLKNRRRHCRGAKESRKDVAKAGAKQWCLYLLTILCPSSWIIEQMDWG